MNTVQRSLVSGGEIPSTAGPTSWTLYPSFVACSSTKDPVPAAQT